MSSDQDSDVEILDIHPGIVSISSESSEESEYDDEESDIEVERRRAIEISDNLNIQFNQSLDDQFCIVKIENNGVVPILLTAVQISLSTVTLPDGFKYEWFRMIEPNEAMELQLKVAFVPQKFTDFAKIEFDFGYVLKVIRTMKITYRARGPAIRGPRYDLPNELIHLIATENPSSSHSDAVVEYLPSIDADYAKHFHNLFYLEEIYQRGELKKKYNENVANFREVSVTYYNRIGVFDLEVKDLYETSPSLQIGDKVIARKRSAPHIQYKGDIIQIKSSNLICIEFGIDFVHTFDHSAYFVDFDFSRTSWVRMHFAIDLALDLFGINYLIPNEISKRNSNLLEVELNDEGQLELMNGTVLNWFNDQLNWHQKETVANILRGSSLHPYLIHGPPGTGKTTALTEIILQILTKIKNSNILIVTQSNSAANLIVQRITRYDLVNTNNLLRLVARTYVNKVEELPDDIKDYALTVDDLLPNSRSSMTKRLISIKRFRMVVGTSTTIAKLLEARELRNHFTHAIVDEAGQSTEMGVLVPMALIGKNGQTIMAGDPMQMSPLVLCSHANDLSISMLSRLLNRYSEIEVSESNNRLSYDPRLVSKLFLNYRSLPSVMEFYNSQFYDSELMPTIEAENSREARVVNIISRYIFGRCVDYGIYFMNVDGQHVHQTNSLCNPREICVIVYLIQLLKKWGFQDDTIGIITPYSSQVRFIGQSVREHPGIEVGTVEEFQGLERQIILISTVRTRRGNVDEDQSRYLGFIKCPKRINVAVSRARGIVIVVGDGVLLSADENWNALIQRCKTNNTFAKACIDKHRNTFKTRKIEFL